MFSGEEMGSTSSHPHPMKAAQVSYSADMAAFPVSGSPFFFSRN